MNSINNQERALILCELIDYLSEWDWTDNFEMTQLEGEAVLYILQRWKKQRMYQQIRYEANRDTYQRRYKKDREALRKKRLKKLHDKL